MNPIDGKKIILTGATSGIGKYIASELLKRGANLACCGKSPEKMLQLQEELKSVTSGIFFSKAFDVTIPEEISSFVNEAKKKLGGVDVLINCAGLNSARAVVEDIQMDDLEYMLQVNMKAPLMFIQQVIKDMKLVKKGQIINILSTVCLFSNEGIGAYTASKAGFDALIKVLRKEVRKDNILISSIYPGGVNTPFRPNERPDYLRPEDVANAVIYVLEGDNKIAHDEIVLRPFVETNFS
jgi:NADP-dependent 3-hydroxy acid dehydrogenase YdfG